MRRRSISLVRWVQLAALALAAGCSDGGGGGDGSPGGEGPGGGAADAAAASDVRRDAGDGGAGRDAGERDGDRDAHEGAGQDAATGDGGDAHGAGSAGTLIPPTPAVGLYVDEPTTRREWVTEAEEVDVGGRVAAGVGDLRWTVDGLGGGPVDPADERGRFRFSLSLPPGRLVVVVVSGTRGDETVTDSLVLVRNPSGVALDRAPRLAPRVVWIGEDCGVSATLDPGPDTALDASSLRLSLTHPDGSEGERLADFVSRGEGGFEAAFDVRRDERADLWVRAYGRTAAGDEAVSPRTRLAVRPRLTLEISARLDATLTRVANAFELELALTGDVARAQSAARVELASVPEVRAHGTPEGEGGGGVWWVEEPGVRRVYDPVGLEPGLLAAPPACPAEEAHEGRPRSPHEPGSADVAVYSPHEYEWGAGFDTGISLWHRLREALCPRLRFDVAVNREATLDRFAGMLRAGVLIVGTHGNTYFAGAIDDEGQRWGGPAGVVVLGSGEELTEASRTRYWRELLDGQLVERRDHFAIAPGFVEEHACLDRAIVLLSACRSAYNSSMAEAFLRSGAHIVLGFSEVLYLDFATRKADEVFRLMIEEHLSASEAAQRAGGEGPGTGPAADSDRYRGAVLRFYRHGNARVHLPSGSLVSPGFEDPDAFGTVWEGRAWETYGGAQVVGSGGDFDPALQEIAPADGSRMAVLHSQMEGVTFGWARQRYCFHAGEDYRVRLRWRAFGELVGPTCPHRSPNAVFLARYDRIEGEEEVFVVDRDSLPCDGWTAGPTNYQTDWQSAEFTVSAQPTDGPEWQYLSFVASQTSGRPFGVFIDSVEIEAAE